MITLSSIISTVNGLLATSVNTVLGLVGLVEGLLK